MAFAHLSRRQFVRTAAAGGVAALAAPTILTAQKTDRPPVVGSGEHRYEVLHNWPQLPDKYTWQTTHNVAIDAAGNLYVIHEGSTRQPDHPAVFVFDPTGKFVRAFGNQFQGGGHGIEVRREGSDEFLYVCAYKGLKTFAKLNLAGDVVWQRWAPMDAGVYAAGEDTAPADVWGRDRFMPTNFAFLDDGGFLVADGYGAYCVHQYDKDANYVSTFGGPSTSAKEDGLFNTPHGIWIDHRPGGEPSIVVADRANGRLQWFSLTGEHQQTLDGFRLPANVDTHGEVLLVPDLEARVTLLDGQNNVIAQLGDDAAWHDQVMADNRRMRTQPDRWQAGRFIHPHDACFDAEGNIFVAEWVDGGRITKLRRVG